MVDLPPFRKCLALCIHFVQMETVCRAQTIQALKMPRFHPYFLQMSKIKLTARSLATMATKKSNEKTNMNKNRGRDKRINKLNLKRKTILKTIQYIK